MVLKWWLTSAGCVQAVLFELRALKSSDRNTSSSPPVFPVRWLGFSTYTLPEVQVQLPCFTRRKCFLLKTEVTYRNMFDFSILSLCSLSEKKLGFLVVCFFFLLVSLIQFYRKRFKLHYSRPCKTFEIIFLASRENFRELGGGKGRGAKK